MPFCRLASPRLTAVRIAPMIKPSNYACKAVIRLISRHIYLCISPTPNWLSLSDLHFVQRNLASRPMMIV